jgi:hypothetical protein
MGFTFAGWGWVAPITCVLFVLAGLLAGIQATRDYGCALLIAITVVLGVRAPRGHRVRL